MENWKALSDIVAVQGMSCSIPIEDFLRLADVEYDSGFGAQEVAKDLIVLWNNWWLERHEYDGSEWREYKELPKMKPLGKVDTLISNAWGK
jgi:hypothetical protein